VADYTAELERQLQALENQLKEVAASSLTHAARELPATQQPKRSTEGSSGGTLLEDPSVRTVFNALQRIEEWPEPCRPKVQQLRDRLHIGQGQP